MKKKVTLKIIIIILLVSTTVSSSGDNFIGHKARDPYPLQHILKYRYTGRRGEKPLSIVSEIVKNLDIESNPRYFKVGVLYKGGKAYEIPLTEVEDFNLKTSHTNTYCNIFVIDVLNIMANTTKDETYRISKTPINANELRTAFENSLYWERVSKEDAVRWSKAGEVVVLSYVAKPHGHVAFVKFNSDLESIYLWNVGAVNSNNLKWNTKGDVEYYRKVD